MASNLILCQKRCFVVCLFDVRREGPEWQLAGVGEVDHGVDVQDNLVCAAFALGNRSHARMVGPDSQRCAWCNNFCLKTDIRCFPRAVFVK